MLNIYQYTDYRKFLADLYAARKGANKAFSYRYIANKAGFASPSFFGKILAGDTNISNQTLMRLVDVFQLVGTDAEYFELLVNFERASTQSDKSRYFQRMQAVRKASGRTVSDQIAVLHSRWFVSPILALLEMNLFTGDYAKLGLLVTPPITAQDTLFAIESLMQSKLVSKDQDGRLVARPPVCQIPSHSPSEHEPEIHALDPEKPFSTETISTIMQKLPETIAPDLHWKILATSGELQRLVQEATRNSDTTPGAPQGWTESPGAGGGPHEGLAVDAGRIGE